MIVSPFQALQKGVRKIMAHQLAVKRHNEPFWIIIGLTILNIFLAMRPTLQNFLVTGGAEVSPQVNPLQGVNVEKFAEL